MWGLKSGHLQKRLAGHRDVVRDVAIWPDDATLISSSNDGSVRIWDLETDHCIDMLEEHDSIVWSLACCSNERTFVSGSEDGSVCVWEMTEQKRTTLSSTIQGNAEGLEAIAWSPTEPVVVTGSTKGIIPLGRQPTPGISP
ncbi:hypothetical protein KFU94_35005 [Chloroflexi bacterium TSY]|nr:hypothetical protein [Chloroflexi bacterium TSY]